LPLNYTNGTQPLVLRQLGQGLDYT